MTMTSSPARLRAPAVDPRIRQRWIQARRQEGRRRLRVLLVAAAVVGLAAGGLALLHSPVLAVRRVLVSGLTSRPGEVPLTPTEIAARAGLSRRTPMVDVNPLAVAHRVEQLPWVATARVTQSWPGTVRVAVHVRTAVAEVPRVAGRPADGVALVDATGRVLGLLPGSATAGGTGAAGRAGSAGQAGVARLPLLASAVATEAPGAWIPARSGVGLTSALRAAAALPSSLAAQVSTISVGAPGLELAVGSTTVVFGSAAHLRQKVASLQTIVDQVDLARVATVDLQVPDRPALTPVRSARRALSLTPGQAGTNLSTTSGG